MKKRTLSTIIVTLVIIAGLGLLLYPTVSDYVNSLAYRRAIADFRNSVEKLDEKTYVDLLASAREYNARLAAAGKSFLTLDEDRIEEYESLLNFTGTGIMGYIEIPKVEIYLPIYHGTGDAVLQAGVGHLEGSSLPVGGENTHCVLSAHTGLPSAKLFTNIDRLVEGDVFTVRVLRETLTYEVDQILVVLPYEVSSLRIEDGQDYCTLLTCTPYGVNTHRLLVRGHRIPTPVEETAPVPDVPLLDDGRLFGLDAEIVLLIAAAALLLVILVIILLIRRHRRRTQMRAPLKKPGRYAKNNTRKNQNRRPED